MKHINAAVLIFCGFLTFHEASIGAESTVPEPFQGYDNTSQLAINYEDLSDLLRTVVVDAGQSTRVAVESARATTGTRMKPRARKFTSKEGNRFHYEAFEDNEEARKYLHNIQDSLEQLPSETPLENFSRDEQLAYWLNLYNVTLLNEIIAAYPKRSLKKLFRGRNSIVEKKLLNVAGIPLSLNDIQFTILKNNYNSNPLIIYGLYQGIVGGPNIRTTAFNGGTVYHALEDNAFRFVNSNRGTFSRSDEDFVRVSSFYDRNRVYFPDFKSDLSKHLLQYLEGKERQALQAATRVKADIDDWNVTDLGHKQHRIGGSLAHNQAAMLDAYRGSVRKVSGGVDVAPVIIKPKEEVPEEDDVAAEDIEISPVEGAAIEEIVSDDPPE